MKEEILSYVPSLCQRLRVPVFVTALACAALLPGAARAFSRPDSPPPHVQSKPTADAETSYYGVYLQKARLGYGVATREAHAMFNGHPAVESDMTMTMDLKVFGSPNQIVTTDQSWCDPKTGAPLASRSSTSSSGRVTTISAVYAGRSLIYTADIQGSATRETLNLNPGEQFLIDPSDGANFKPKAGMKLSGKIFSAETFKLIDAEIEVGGPETVAINGQLVRAFRILEKNAISPTTVWTNSDGDMLRIDMPMGLQMLKESKEAALAPAAAGAVQPDIAAMASITPTGKPLSGDAPRSAGKIIYEISGITKTLPPDDTVQSASYTATPAGGAAVPGDLTAQVSVHPLALPESAGVVRFGSKSVAPERLRRFLAATAYVPCDSSDFVRLAREIVGDETDIAKAAAKIAEYVHTTIKPDTSIAALRSANDIRKDPRGVCRDYTTLFATIARAAGIPTKQCVGIGYGELADGSGKFIGHAWPEVWTGTSPDGTDRWVALEPTWGAPFADATHIKLAEGEITDFFSVSGDLGRYRIRVEKIQ